MNKFLITEIPVVEDETKPVLYKIWIGKRYYLHKGKALKDSAERFLDDVFRGMRSKSCPEAYTKVVEYCALHPQIYKASLDVVLNSDPAKVLRKEAIMYKAMKTDEESLNRLDLEPYKPEWMIRQSLQARCEICVKTGIVNGKTMAFKFCPNCGRLNK